MVTSKEFENIVKLFFSYLEYEFFAVVGVIRSAFSDVAAASNL